MVFLPRFLTYPRERIELISTAEESINNLKTGKWESSKIKHRQKRVIREKRAFKDCKTTINSLP